MPEANPHYKATTYMLTRRCERREFLLKPCEMVNAVVFWVLAYAALLARMEVHALCVMSNHYHLIITDVHGVLPEFTTPLHKFVSAALNRFFRRRGHLFDEEREYWVTLGTGEDILDKMVYVLTNPVAAGLVRSIDQWPGAWLGPLSEMDAPKPGIYFLENNLPNLFRLATTKPPGFEDLSDKEFKELLWGRIRAREAEIAEEMRHSKRKFLGRKKVLACSHLDTPKTPDTKLSDAGGRIKPRVAAKDKELRKALIKRLKVFREHYYEALALYREGFFDVVFPVGTWQMAQRFDVRCAET